MLTGFVAKSRNCDFATFAFHASTRPEWKLEVLTGHPSELEEAVRIGRPDGIVSGFTDEPMNPIPVRYRTMTPTVFTCARPFKGMSAPFVELDMDDSAIARTAAEAGFTAAEALDRLMDGRKTARHLTVGVRGIVKRLSASDLSGSSNRVSRALELIRQKAVIGMTVPMIAQTVGCSTRLLEKDFKKTIGHSIIDELNRIRLAKVQELLRNTLMDDEAVAAASGFGSGAYLRNLFRKRFGLTMRAWRQQHAKTVPL